MTVAAGHAASYALAVGAAAPNSTGPLCLIAPTWRGPLPTMMGGKRKLGEWIARAGDLPVLGQLLYRLNVNPPVVRMMARGHVYVDPDWLQGERLAQKMTVVRATGARHASIRFVTGMLDLMTSRSDFVEAARQFKDPILVLYGAATPGRSKAEMQALAALPNVCSVELPSGKLGVHEEFPDEVAESGEVIPCRAWYVWQEKWTDATKDSDMSPTAGQRGAISGLELSSLKVSLAYAFPQVVFLV